MPDNRPYNRAGRGQELTNALSRPAPASFDEWGTPYDAEGNSLAQPPMSWGEMALTGLASPVQLGIGLAGALSPYGVEEGWRVPPAISEPIHAGQRLFSQGGTFEQNPTPDSEKDMQTVLLSLYGGNALRGATRNALATEAGAVASSHPMTLADRAAIREARDAEEHAFRQDLFSSLIGERLPDPPQNVWHGTDAEFQAYDPHVARSRSDAANDAGTDIMWASPNKGLAEKFGNPRPLTISEGKFFHRENLHDLAAISSYIDGLPDAPNIWRRIENGNWGFLENKDTINALKDLGYDGAKGQEVFYDAKDRPRTAQSVSVWTRGKVLNPDGSVFFSDTGKPSLLGSALASQEPIRAYHGTVGELTGGTFDRNRAGKNFQNKISESGVSFSSSPDLASEYADSASTLSQMDSATNMQDRSWLSPMLGSNVIPVDITGRGFKIELAPGASQQDIFEQIAAAKSHGYDFAEFKTNGRNFSDGLDGRDVFSEYNVWTPGTVRSATTGETLFSDTKPSLMGSALASQEPKGITAYHGSPHDFDLETLMKYFQGP